MASNDLDISTMQSLNEAIATSAKPSWEKPGHSFDPGLAVMCLLDTCFAKNDGSYDIKAAVAFTVKKLGKEIMKHPSVKREIAIMKQRNDIVKKGGKVNWFVPGTYVKRKKNEEATDQYHQERMDILAEAGVDVNEAKRKSVYEGGPTLKELKKRYGMLTLKWQKLTTGKTKYSPEVIKLNKEIEELRDRIADYNPYRVDTGKGYDYDKEILKMRKS